MDGMAPRAGRGATRTQLRAHNLSAVLRAVHADGALSRADLTARTGLNRSTVGALVAALSERGMVEEVSPRPTATRGRPSPLVRPRADSAVVIAVEIAVTSLAVSTIGFGGHVFGESRVEYSGRTHGPERTVKRVAQLISGQLAKLAGSARTVGVGVGVPGVTRRTDGFVHLAPNLGWHDIPLKQMLESALDHKMPVLVANEADLAALGEQRRGVARGVDNLIFLSGDIGVGAGIIMSGTPLLGVAGYAGEAGHMLIDPAGARCWCGATGCWETKVGMRALQELSRGGREASAGDIERRASDGDRDALAALEKVGWWLGQGIGNLVNIMNVGLVVLGGIYAQLAARLMPSLAQGLRGRALVTPGALARIEPSVLATHACRQGAAEVLFEGIIRRGWNPLLSPDERGKRHIQERS